MTADLSSDDSSNINTVLMDSSNLINVNSMTPCSSLIAQTLDFNIMDDDYSNSSFNSSSRRMSGVESMTPMKGTGASSRRGSMQV
jgi:hypothetical protein